MASCNAQSCRGRRDRLRLHAGHVTRGGRRDRGCAGRRRPVPEGRAALTAWDGHARLGRRCELSRSKGRTTRRATRQVHRQSTAGRDRSTRASLASHRDRAEVRGGSMWLPTPQETLIASVSVSIVRVNFCVPFGAAVRSVDAHGVGADGVSPWRTGQEAGAGEGDARGQGGRSAAAERRVRERGRADPPTPPPGSCSRCRRRSSSSLRL